MTNEHNDREALRKIRSTYEDALNNRDLEKIRPLLADDFTGVVISGDEVRSFEDIEAFLHKVWGMVGEGGKHHVEIGVDQTDFFGDLAVSRGYNDEVFHTAAGKEYAFRARWTVVARRQNGEWKIYRVHAGLNPMDNVIVTEIVGRAKMTFGLCGLAAGLVLGIAACSLWSRK
jgi:uncharacterized protein (TIGR02246 family)